MFAQNDTPISIHERVELPDEQLRALAPSVFAAQAMPGVSSRYAFVPTAQLVGRLRNAGWAPVSAVEQKVKLDERRGFQKHLIRFQRRDVVPVKGEYTPELRLINSHDRSSAYQLHAGLYRFICANGMFVGDGNAFERVSIRHAGFTPDEVIEASFRILDQVSAFLANGSHRIPRTRSQRARRNSPNAACGECHALRRKCVGCLRRKATLRTRRCNPSRQTSRYDPAEQNCPAPDR